MKNESGSAFPIAELDRKSEYDTCEFVLRGGLTKREWFAGMVASYSASCFNCYDSDYGKKVADKSFQIADAMLLFSSPKKE